MAWRNAVVVGGVTASVLALTACGGSLGGGANSGGATGGSGAGGMVAQLTFPAEVDASAGGLVNYNPLAAKPLTTTWLYEPLIVRNNISCQESPWLATKATWEGNNKLTLDIRDGVKWSDGQPFTAKDVAFTFNAGKQFPAADKAGVWTDTFGSKATSVEAKWQPGGPHLRWPGHRQVPGDHRDQDPARAHLRRGGRPDEVRRQGRGRDRPVQGRELQRPPPDAGPP